MSRVACACERPRPDCGPAPGSSGRPVPLPLPEDSVPPARRRSLSSRSWSSRQPQRPGSLGASGLLSLPLPPVPFPLPTSCPLPLPACCHPCCSPSHSPGSSRVTPPPPLEELVQGPRLAPSCKLPRFWSPAAVIMTSRHSVIPEGKGSGGVRVPACTPASPLSSQHHLCLLVSGAQNNIPIRHLHPSPSDDPGCSSDP